MHANLCMHILVSSSCDLILDFKMVAKSVCVRACVCVELRIRRKNYVRHSWMDRTADIVFSAYCCGIFVLASFVFNITLHFGQ